MIRQAVRSVVLVALAFLILALGTPTWAFGGDSPVRLFNSFGSSFGSRGGATFHFRFGHLHFFPHHRHRGFFVLGFQKVWVPGQWVWIQDHWEWAPGQWGQIPKGVGVWVPGRWIVLDP